MGQRAGFGFGGWCIYPLVISLTRLQKTLYPPTHSDNTPMQNFRSSPIQTVDPFRLVSDLLGE